MKQNQNIALIKKIFHEVWPTVPIRFIKIHGSQYQEAGLPDLMILLGFLCHGADQLSFWVEVKRDWKDEPSDLQKYNVKNLKWYGYYTGFIAGDEFKHDWGEKLPIFLKEYLANNF